MNRFIDYYYYFHHMRHYFECHEIMEEQWKSKPDFSKDDVEVALILLATSQYHLRRHNTKGAHTCLKKAVQLFSKHQSELESIGLEETVVQYLDHHVSDMNYKPLHLPVTKDFEQQIRDAYPKYLQCEGYEPSYLNYHSERDRSEIIELRYRQLMRNKYPVDDTPD